MTKEKKIFTGTYVFGDMNSGSSFGGISGVIALPDYSHELMLFLNTTHENKTEQFENAKVFNLSISELESVQKSIERLLNDMRKLESLSRKNLLRDEAYS